MTLKQAVAAMRGSLLNDSHDIEISGVSTDTRTLEPGDIFFALSGPNHDGHDHLEAAAARGAIAAVVSKKAQANKVPYLPIIVVDDTLRGLQDFAAKHRQNCPATVIGITGSNGKTTTKEMISHILSGVVPVIATTGNHNNLIGVPLTLLSIRPEHIYAIVEMGTNAHGEIERLCEVADPDLGVLTNVGEAHLEGLGSLEGVAKEKSALLKHTATKGGGFYNADNYWSRYAAKHIKGSVSAFAFENEADTRAINLQETEDGGVTFKIAGGPRITMNVPGAHNAMNALAAISLARKLGYDWDTIANRLATFSLPKMRLEKTEAAGVTLINDAYNANPASVEAAIKTLSRMSCVGKKYIVIGDMLELGSHSHDEHRKIGTVAGGAKFSGIWGVGEHASELIASARKAGMAPENLHIFDSTEGLSGSIARRVSAGDIVLFKGSRRIKLEVAITELTQRLAPEEKPAAEPKAQISSDIKAGAAAPASQISGGLKVH